MYGLPQYSVSIPEGVSIPVVTSQTLSLLETLVNLDTDIDPAPFCYFGPNGEEIGCYYTSNGLYQATPFRPVQPKITVPLNTELTDPVHGVLLLGGTFIDDNGVNDLGFNPVITRPTSSWELVSEEIQLLPPTYWPAELFTVNTLVSGSETTQTLVIIPGQFKATGTREISGVDQIIGTQRNYTTLDYELTSSDSEDFEAPTVTGIDINESDDNIIVSVSASDISGIARIVILQYNDGTGEVTLPFGGDLVLDTLLPLSGTFDIEIPDPGTNSLIIQTVDGAGNVATNTGRGSMLNVISIEVEPVVVVRKGTEFTLNAQIQGFDIEKEPYFYTWDMGDGNFKQGISTDGNITVNHIYPDADEPIDIFTTKLKVTDSAGGIGNAVTVVKVFDFDWTDPVDNPNNPDGDLIGASMNNNDEVSIALVVVGEISPEYQYRIVLRVVNTNKVFNIKWDGKKVTGIKGAKGVGFAGGMIQITFDTSKLGVISEGDLIEVQFETQAGVPSDPGEGFPDYMPDEGCFEYIVN
jgi:hypothetical protein